MSSDKDKAQIPYEKKIQSLVQQLKDSTNQIDMLQAEIEHLRGRVTTCCRELEEMKRQLGQRDDAISCFESKFNNLHFEFKETEKTNQRVVECLQSKIVACHEQIQQRESALIMCKNEAKSQETSMEEARSDFVCELQQKENCLMHMKDDIRRVYDELKCKTDSNNVLERSVGDLKSRHHQTSCQIKDADGKISCLLEKIQQIECQNNREKSQSAKELEEFEKKLTQSCNDLCMCQNDNRKWKRCIQDHDEKIHVATSDVNSLSRDIQNIKQESCCLQERAASLESDNKEICRMMQQKVKCIKEMETALCIKKEELEQCKCCVEQLEETIRRLTNRADEKDESDDLENQLKICREKLKKTQEALDQCTKQLEWAAGEMENMAKEIKRLNCEVEEASRQLNEKNSLIGDLERTIEHAEQDMENRIRRVDEQLQKYEKEIKDKMNMISEGEEKCCRYEKSLGDKDSELEEADHKLCRSNCEIGHLCGKVKELEDLRDLLQKKNNDQRVQYTELIQDCKCTKDQLESVSLECGDTTRDLTCCQRDLENVRREAEELAMDLQEKDVSLCRLTEEKSCLSNKVSNLQFRLEADTSLLTQQLSDMRYRLESEMDQLRNRQMEADENNATLTKKLSAGQRQLAQLEKSYYQKVDTFNRENQNLQTKIADKDDQLQAIKDTITLRDSEIMRLKMRLCSGDRCSNNISVNVVSSHPKEDIASQANNPDDDKCRKRSQSCGSKLIAERNQEK